MTVEIDKVYNCDCLEVTLPQLSRKYGINQATLYTRLHEQGMDIATAIETPLFRKRCD